jgi:hypothetical protein
MDQPVRGRPFQKGQSGNPAGRPPVGASVAERIREFGGRDGSVYVEQLHRLAVADDTDPRTRVAVIGVLLDRGYGRAPQELDASGSGGAIPQENLERLSDEELTLLKALVKKTTGTPVPQLTALWESVAGLARQLAANSDGAEGPNG